MLDNNIKIEVKEGKEFTPLPENIYQVELLDISSEKRPTYDTRMKPDDEKQYEIVLNFQFVLLAGKDKDGTLLRGRNLWANFVPTYLYISSKNGKNKLYQITEALLGRDLSPEDEAKMDGEYLNGLIGKQCRIGTKNKTKDDKTFTRTEMFYSIDATLEALNDEEKENARVKTKDATEGQNGASEGIVEDNSINPEDIPFD